MWLAPGKIQGLKDRFGKGSYVVITGTTAGIGRSLAKDFAKLGFNIIQISRDKKKLDEVEKELKSLNPSVKVLTVVLNMFECNQPGFFDDLWAQTKDLDISIVVNNAGVDCLMLFHELTTQFVADMVNVNVNAVALLTKLYIEKLYKRKNDTAVICLSSLAGVKAMSYFNVYCATKAFVEMFCESLSIEYPRTQFLSIRPSEVST